MSLNVKVASALHQGKKRKSQQDRVVTVANGGCVADGMGGHLGGAEAATICVNTFEAQYKARQPTTIELAREFVQDCVEKADVKVHEEAQLDASLAGMGSTMVAGVVLEDTLVAATVGDSRVYRLSGGVLTQLSEDHSRADLLYRQGLMTAEEAAASDLQHVLYRVCGHASGERGDLIEQAVVAGDRLLFCTDGVDKHVTDAVVAVLLGTGDDPQTIADAIVQAALDGGGSDNIGVLVMLVVA